MFVMLGASGNTGKVVAQTLLTQKKKVRVVLRDAAKGQAWKDAGADVSIADVENGAALERAFRGALSKRMERAPCSASATQRRRSLEPTLR